MIWRVPPWLPPNTKVQLWASLLFGPRHGVRDPYHAGRKLHSRKGGNTTGEAAACRFKHWRYVYVCISSDIMGKNRVLGARLIFCIGHNQDIPCPTLTNSMNFIQFPQKVYIQQVKTKIIVLQPSNNMGICLLGIPHWWVHNGRWPRPLLGPRRYNYEPDFVCQHIDLCMIMLWGTSPSYMYVDMYTYLCIYIYLHIYGYVCIHNCIFVCNYAMLNTQLYNV